MALYPSLLPGSVRRLFWATAYGFMARAWQRADWRLMNYGYEPPEGDVGGRPALAAEDEPDRNCLQLYHRVVSQRPIAGKRVLEIGCGRGGGAAYVCRYLRPACVAALDRSSPTVKLAARQCSCPGLTYQVGDAEALPLPDESVDVVINVESCHCYGSIPRFLSEVKRVLVPGGSLLLADLRLAGRLPALDADLQASGLVVEDRVDITRGVVRGLSADSARRERLIAESAWPGMRRLMRMFSGTVGSVTFRDLDNGTFLYYCYALRKP